MKSRYLTQGLTAFAALSEPVLANNYTTFAEDAFGTLQNWYNESTGLWRELIWWHSPQAVTVIADLAAVDQTIMRNATKIFETTHALAPKHNTQNPGHWTNEFFDNQMRWALAWIAAYDVTNEQAYLDTAEHLFRNTTGAWPTTCVDGGVIWNRARHQVNAITNGLFMSVGAHLANRVSTSSKDFYLDWTLRTYDWFQHSGMITSTNVVNYLINNKTCQNSIPQSIWSYNQGVILGGLVELDKAAPNSTYLPQAEAIASAALARLGDANGIIHDHCEPQCNLDDCMFKGVFIRNLAKLQAVVQRGEYKEAILRNADSVWRNDRSGYGDFGQVWSQLEGQIYPTSHTSGMDALVAAAGVC